MKSVSCVISISRYFSTQPCGKSTKWTSRNFWHKKKSIENEPTTSKTIKIKWTHQQSEILKSVSDGKSVFITGSAGTGKTMLVQHIIKKLKRIHGRSHVFVTASTGVAACVLQGQTLHSFAGIGLGEADPETLLSRVVSDRRAYLRWNKAQALVVDEISMIDADFFDSLEYIARKIREEKHGCGDKTWGGLQLIVSGDFFQLPPIANLRNKRGARFAFEAKCWNASFDMQLELKQIFRQSEAQLVKLLQSVRRGDRDPEVLQLLENHCSDTEPDPSVVRIYPMNEDVNRVNKSKLENLKQKNYVYHALDSSEKWKKQLNQGIAPEELELCIGARVMLCKNLKPFSKLVNGSTGTVTDFRWLDDIVKVDGSGKISDNVALPIVEFDSGQEMVMHPEYWHVMEGEKVVASRKQIPLILAWAMSIHKCQGMTLDSLHTNLSRAFDFGMVYVALSRVKSLGGLHLSGFNPSKIKAHPKVLEFYKSFSVGPDGVEDDLSMNESSSNSLRHHANDTSGKRAEPERIPFYL